MKGGRRFGFSALVVLGDGRGVVGLGFGKAREVPPAVEKAITDARKHCVRVSLVGTTIPHPVTSRFRSSVVKLIPAAPGTGIIAGDRRPRGARGRRRQGRPHEGHGQQEPDEPRQGHLRGSASMRTRKQVEALRGVTLR